MINEKLLNKISKLLQEKKYKLATAESCTGGLLANLFTNISGSSEFFERGIVSYSNNAKKELLDVSEDLLDQYGAVSRQVAEAMAVGICEKSNVDIGISTTGIAGPLGGTYDKPVGLVFIGVSTRYETLVKKFNFNGNRLENKNSTVNSAFEMILEILK